MLGLGETTVVCMVVTFTSNLERLNFNRGLFPGALYGHLPCLVTCGQLRTIHMLLLSPSTLLHSIIQSPSELVRLLSNYFRCTSAVNIAQANRQNRRMPLFPIYCASHGIQISHWLCRCYIPRSIPVIQLLATMTDFAVGTPSQPSSPEPVHRHKSHTNLFNFLFTYFLPSSFTP